MLEDDFELLAPVSLNLVCFRYHPGGIKDEGKLNEINQELLNRINATGQIYLTHTKLNGSYTLRMVIANTRLEERHVDGAWELITRAASELLR